MFVLFNLMQDLISISYSLLSARIFTIETSETITHNPHSIIKKLSNTLK